MDILSNKRVVDLIKENDMNIENTNRDCVMGWVRGFLDTSLQRFGQVKTKHQNLNKLFCENGFTLAEVLQNWDYQDIHTFGEFRIYR